MLETADTFIRYRQNQEDALLGLNPKSGELSGLLTIEFNLTELCNRVCSFCPRVDASIYPNLNLTASTALVKRVASEIKRVGFHSKMSFSGFGEPLLHPDFESVIRRIRKSVPDIILETNTNGDKISVDRLNKLYEAGLNSIYWNLYDGPDQIAKASEIIEASSFPTENVRLRPHWEGYDLEREAGLILNNRSGALAGSELDSPLARGCNYPFYKMLIDWNGNILCCSNDWLRKKIIGNILTTSIDQIWFDPEWHRFRLRLLAGSRDQKPCSGCDIDGTLFGSVAVAQYTDAASNRFVSLRNL